MMADSIFNNVLGGKFGGGVGRTFLFPLRRSIFVGRSVARKTETSSGFAGLLSIFDRLAPDFDDLFKRF